MQWWKQNPDNASAMLQICHIQGGGTGIRAFLEWPERKIAIAVRSEQLAPTHRYQAQNPQILLKTRETISTITSDLDFMNFQSFRHYILYVIFTYLYILTWQDLTKLDTRWAESCARIRFDSSTAPWPCHCGWATTSSNRSVTRKRLARH